MKTMFDLYKLAAKHYNENLWAQKYDPDTVECLGLKTLLDLHYDLCLKMSTIEECAETFGATYIQRTDKNGFIIKVYSLTPGTGAAAEYDFDLGEFVAVPYEALDRPY